MTAPARPPEPLPSVTDAPVDPTTVRHVRALDGLGVPRPVTAAVTGCPAVLIPEIVEGRIGGEPDPEQIRADLAWLAVADRARDATLAEPTPAEIEEVAAWLADASGSPRYAADGLGPAALLDSEANIEHAYGAAVRRLGPTFGQADIDSLGSARSMLLRHATEAANAPG